MNKEELSSQATDKMVMATQAIGGPAKETITAIIAEGMNKGVLPKNIINFGDETMEAIYGQAYNMYNLGRYQDASYIFKLLMMLDYMEPKYVLGLGACLHRMKEYNSAANVYLLCSTLDATNPMPHYHAADCYLQLDVPTLAIFSLGLAIDCAGDQEKYAVIKERATLMKEALYTKIRQSSTTTSQEA